MRVSGGDLCTKCRSTDRAGRRDQVLLPLPKRNSHRFGDCFFFVRQNLSEARACRASSPSAAGGRCSEARMAQRSKYGVTPPYFGHRKRGCEATSSPSAPAKKNSHRCGDCFFRYGEFTDPKHFSAKIFSVPHRKLQSWRANLPELQAIQMQCRNAVQKSMPPITESQG